MPLRPGPVQVCGVNRTGGNGTVARLKVGAFTVWNGNTWGLRRSLLPWIQWHTQLGVCRFYVSFASIPFLFLFSISIRFYSSGTRSWACAAST